MIVLALGLGIARAEGISNDQANAILNELKEIRKLLERMGKGGLSPGKRSLPSTPVKVSTMGKPVLGDPNAPLSLVEFTDYQCFFCKKFFLNTLPQLKKNHIDTGKLRLVIRDFPLNNHIFARQAAQASHCAGDQGKFWKMHDSLFKGEGKLKRQDLLGYAKNLSLNMEQFHQCLDSGKHLDEIDKDIAAGSKVKITGTPAFILGKTTENIITGFRLFGAKPFATFDKRLKSLLKFE